MKFGHPVTSIFVKNSQKPKKFFFITSVNAEESGALAIAPFFDIFKKIKTSVKFGKNSRNAEVLKGLILVGEEKTSFEENASQCNAPRALFFFRLIWEIAECFAVRIFSLSPFSAL